MYRKQIWCRRYHGILREKWRPTGITTGNPPFQHLHFWLANHCFQEVCTCWWPGKYSCQCKLAVSAGSSVQRPGGSRRISLDFQIEAQHKQSRVSGFLPPPYGHGRPSADATDVAALGHAPWCYRAKPWCFCQILLALENSVETAYDLIAITQCSRLNGRWISSNLIIERYQTCSILMLVRALYLCPTISHSLFVAFGCYQRMLRLQ